MQKQCTKCGKLKDINEFSWKDKKKKKRHTQCKECRQKKREKHKKETKEKIHDIREYVRHIKENGCCAKCGEKRWYLLDFHHLHSKLFNISEKIRDGISLESVKNEINKCILLCANCHRELHYFRDLENKNTKK